MPRRDPIPAESPPVPSSSSTSSPSTRKQQLLHVPPPPTSAYVHLPFCVKKCFYCDFPVRALGEAGAQSLLPNGTKEKSRTLPEGVSAYLDALLAEIAATSPAAADPTRPLPPLQTISFGGGTPSLLPPSEIARLVSALSEKFGGLAEDAEVSLEADPGTFDAESVAGYVGAGVTRLSVGVQSFDEEVLKGCGRSHGVGDVEKALEVVSAARRNPKKSKKKLRSWSLDLVAGLPGLDLGTWGETLRRAVAAGPDHVSVYDLQLEAGTPFGDAAARLESAAKSKKGAAAEAEEEGAAAAAAEEEEKSGGGNKTFTLPGPLPVEDDAAEMLRLASRVLGEAGYVRYEVSNYAKPERKSEEEREEDAEVESHESRHNGVYWRGDEDYYAFGLGASSRFRGVRVTRPRSMRAYSRFVEELATRGDGVPSEGDGSVDSSASSSASAPALDLAPTARDVLLEVAMLRLRTRGGLDLREVAERWGESEARAIREALAPSVAAGFAAEEEEGSISSSSTSSAWPVVRLTDPEGFLVSNSVISDVFVGLDGVPEE